MKHRWNTEKSSGNLNLCSICVSSVACLDLTRNGRTKGTTTTNYTNTKKEVPTFPIERASATRPDSAEMAAKTILNLPLYSCDSCHSWFTFLPFVLASFSIARAGWKRAPLLCKIWKDLFSPPDGLHARKALPRASRTLK